MRYNAYDIQFTGKSADQFNAYSPKLKKQIEKKLEKLAHDPYMGKPRSKSAPEVRQSPLASYFERGKPLQGLLKGLFSYRVGKLRIIYQIKTKEIVVIIVSISHRRESYR